MNHHALPYEYLDLVIDRRDPRPERLAALQGINERRRGARRKVR
jgi:hypothetical protein